jgi:hypothetical protein
MKRVAKRRVSKIAKSNISFVMSVRLSVLKRRKTGFPQDEFFLGRVIFEDFSKSVNKIQVSLHSYKVTGTLHEILCTFMRLCRVILLRMRNVSDKTCKEKKHTFYFQELFPPKSANYDIMWKNTVQPNRP